MIDTRCPRCTRVTLVPRSIGALTVDECPVCHGVWASTAALSAIASDDGVRQDVRAAFAAQADGDLPLRTERAYLPCPLCAALMSRRQFSPGAKIVIDQCRDHGIWFDERELPAVVEAVAREGRDGLRLRDEPVAAPPTRLVPMSDKPAVLSEQGDLPNVQDAHTNLLIVDTVLDGLRLIFK